MNRPRPLFCVFWSAFVAFAIAGCGNDNNDNLNQAAATRTHDESVKEAANRDENPSISRSDLMPEKDWPDFLVKLVKDLRSRNVHPEYIDVKFADPETENPHADGGFYWRMPANQVVLEAHLKTFGLKKAKPGTPKTSKIFDRYPKSWPKPKEDKVTWYAWPFNRDDSGIRAHFWKIMIHDEEKNVLYFFYWIWDIGI